ncbi:tryptophan transporter [Anaerococcus sp.]|uniref:tryptophan transporter n=1 Tax=Anaerococcus sp. TaxID=1872515 RepID=UPI0027BADA59|nr:tryptophan transporter [Anaerococcus sp.]
MKTRNLTISAIFMALGLVMHFLVPPIFGGVKPDFLLSMMFISLIIAGDIKEAILIGVAGGIMSALTTSFPGGQIPNFIEKIIVAIIVFLLIQKFGKGLNKYQTVFIYALGTLLSGVLFLLLALGITKQMNLFIPSLPVVLVAMVVNSIFGLMLMNAYKKIEKMI